MFFFLLLDKSHSTSILLHPLVAVKFGIEGSILLQLWHGRHRGQGDASFMSPCIDMVALCNMFNVEIHIAVTLKRQHISAI